MAKPNQTLRRVSTSTAAISVPDAAGDERRRRIDWWLFLAGGAAVGLAGAMADAVFNNFLRDDFHLRDDQRAMLELPRELPGFSVVFVSALLFFLSSRRLAVVAMILQTLGLALLGLYAKSYAIMLAWLFIMSLGQHLLMPVQPAIGLELARPGEEGKLLGWLNSVRNLAAVAGGTVVFFGFKYWEFNYRFTFVAAAAVILLAATAFFCMHKTRPHPPKTHLRFFPRYRLYYWLTILYGTRKQLFITFAPWVLVKVFARDAATMAMLVMITGMVAIFFQPLLGRAIDRLGERVVLIAEGLLLIVVCGGYGLGRILFGPVVGFRVAAACFVVDGLLMSFGMARATYLKKIAADPAHIAPTLTMGTTIDHVFSITIALVAGYIWSWFGYQYVFLAGAAIALAYAISAGYIAIPTRGEVISASDPRSAARL